jgi:molybdenum cofactor sulfurtransferase
MILNISQRMQFFSSYVNRGRWMVLIDAAKGCATEPLDLSKHPADFVVISFYKVCV